MKINSFGLGLNVFFLLIIILGNGSTYSINTGDAEFLLDQNPSDPLSSPTKHTGEKRELSFQDFSISEVNVTSTYSNDLTLSMLNSSTIIANPNVRMLNFNNFISYRNYISIPAIVLPKLENNGVGDIAYSQGSNPNQLKLESQQSTFTSSLSSTLNSAISQIEKLEIVVDEILFDFETTNLAFANMVLEFNNFNLIVVLKHSASYEDFGFLSNSTNSIKIRWDDVSPIRVNFTKMLELHNLGTPNVLKSISWEVYSNSTYNFSLVIASLQLLSTINSELSINETLVSLDDQTSYSLYPNTSYIIRVIDPSYLFITAYQIVSKTILSTQSITKFKNMELSETGTLVLENYNIGDTLEINFAPFLKLTNISSAGDIAISNGNSFQLTFMGYQVVNFTALYTEIYDSTIVISSLAQGEWLVLENITKTVIGSKIVSPDQKYDSFVVDKLDLKYLIPVNWDKGIVQILLWFDTGEFLHIVENLELYPSKLLSDTEYTIEIGDFMRVPIRLQNLNSLEIFNAESIEISGNSSINASFDKKGITIDSEVLGLGDHKFTVIASVPNLAPQTFELIIHVIAYIPKVSINITRIEIITLSVEIFVENYRLNSVSSYIEIQGEGINRSIKISQKMSIIEITNENWVNSDLLFQIRILSDQNTSSQEIQIRVSKFSGKQNNKSQDATSTTSILIGISIVGIISGLGYYAIKVGKNYFETEKIRF